MSTTITTTIVNLTPHDVVLVREDENGPVQGVIGTGPKAREGKFVVLATYEPTGTVARAAQTDRKVGELEVNGTAVDLVVSAFGDTTDLPDRVDGTFLVVSILTAQAAKANGRRVDDLLITSDPVRNSDGRIVGCQRFAQV